MSRLLTEIKRKSNRSKVKSTETKQQCFPRHYPAMPRLWAKHYLALSKYIFDEYP